MNAQQLREWRRQHPDKQRQYTREWLRRRYYQEWLAENRKKEQETGKADAETTTQNGGCYADT